LLVEPLKYIEATLLTHSRKVLISCTYQNFFFILTGTPILALTGTAGKKLAGEIKKLLCMSVNTKEILVSPDRKNIMYHVELVKKAEELDKLMWLVDLAKKQGPSTPKTIIFCNTYNKIAAVFVYLLRMLQDHVFVPGQPKTPANRIIGIFHSMTLKKYKERVMDSFKVNSGNVRIVLASSALGTGVNFPDVRYVIHLGPAQSIIDRVQQSGRAGRDGKQAYNVVITSGQKLAQCETAVKNFARTKDCLRKAFMQHLMYRLRVYPHCTIAAQTAKPYADAMMKIAVVRTLHLQNVQRKVSQGKHG